MADPEKRFADIVQKLRDHNCRITPQRLAIVRVLAQSTGHPGIEDIYDRLKDDFPSMSLATVYRNVLLIKSLGELLELGFPDSVNRYDGNRPYPHPHVICVSCRKIVDPDLETLSSLEKELAAETGYTILSHRLDFFGVCGECRKGS